METVVHPTIPFNNIKTALISKSQYYLKIIVTNQVPKNLDIINQIESLIFRMRFSILRNPYPTDPTP